MNNEEKIVKDDDNIYDIETKENGIDSSILSYKENMCLGNEIMYINGKSEMDKKILQIKNFEVFQKNILFEDYNDVGIHNDDIDSSDNNNNNNDDNNNDNDNEKNNENVNNKFVKGDVIFLDLSEYNQWGGENNCLYINFSNASKKENNNKNINIEKINLDNEIKNIYEPYFVKAKISENIYAFVVLSDNMNLDLEESNENLRFWSGSKKELKYCSEILSASDYREGYNCIKIKGLNEQSDKCKLNIKVDEITDSDNDGLCDLYEVILGCDIHLNDSDNDGLSDINEVFLTKTNPSKYDSVNDGISDGLYDNDNDGVNNLTEIINESNPNINDTDNDNLSDYEEIYVYNTLVNNCDTDGDWISDGDEIVLGLNPLVSDTDGDGVIDSEEKIEQEKRVVLCDENQLMINSVEVSFMSSDNIDNTTKIDNLLGKDIYLSNVKGLIGCPISIETTSEFDEAILKFVFDKQNIIDSESKKDLKEILNEMVILWYDEENDEFIEEQTFVDEENVSIYTKVNHFSKYLVVNKNSWYDSFCSKIEYDKNNDDGKTVIVAVQSDLWLNCYIDPIFEERYYDVLYPGSLSVERTCYRVKALDNIYNTRNDNDEICVINYSYSWFEYWLMKNDERNNGIELNKDELYFYTKDKMIDNYLYGGFGSENTDEIELDKILFDSKEKMYYELLETIFDEQIPYSSNKDISVLMIGTDGYDININERYINIANEMGIKFDTICYSENKDDNIYKHLAEKTGGKYYSVSTGKEIVDICCELYNNENRYIDNEDVDNDGLLDIYEINGMKLSNGEIIYTDPKIADTDGDGLLDGQEISISPRKTNKFYLNKWNHIGEINNQIFKMTTNPLEADTDKDGLLDGKALYVNDEEVFPIDPDPLVVNINKGLVNKHLRELKFGSRVCHELISYYSTHSENNLEEKVNNVENILLGSFFCNFFVDEKNIALHSKFNTWQEIGGYNNFYDEIFKFGTNDNIGIFKHNFTVNNEEFRIWAWKGDYLNLGSGAEIGIYKKTRTTEKILDLLYAEASLDISTIREEINKHGIDMIIDIALFLTTSDVEGQWEVDKEYALPMKLYLYNYYSEYNIENVFCWEPYNKQWWITGFNPLFNDPNINDMVMIGVIDLYDKEELYWDICKKIEPDNTNKILLDDNTKKIWIVWKGK